MKLPTTKSAIALVAVLSFAGISAASATTMTNGSAAPSFKRFLRCMARILPRGGALRRGRLDQPTAFTAAMSSAPAFCASPYSMRVLSR